MFTLCTLSWYFDFSTFTVQTRPFNITHTSKSDIFAMTKPLTQTVQTRLFYHGNTTHTLQTKTFLPWQHLWHKLSKLDLFDMTTPLTQTVKIRYFTMTTPWHKLSKLDHFNMATPLTQTVQNRPLCHDNSIEYKLSNPDFFTIAIHLIQTIQARPLYHSNTIDTNYRS